jgi:hypothetical protein
MEEVFCKDCKYFSSDVYVICHCPKNKTIHYHKNHYGKWKNVEYLECPSELNKNNDCEWFKLKLWKKWWRAIRNEF